LKCMSPAALGHLGKQVLNDADVKIIGQGPSDVRFDKNRDPPANCGQCHSGNRSLHQCERPPDGSVRPAEFALRR
jgi:hypothetical protein